MQYLLEIKGTTPYFPEKYCFQENTGPSKGGKDYSEEWKDKTYVDRDGYVVLPAEVLKATLINGSKGLHEGKVFMSKLIPAGLILGQMESRILIDGKPITLDDIEKNDWINKFRKVIGSTSNIGVRTQIPTGWTNSWTLITRDEQLTEQRIRAVVENAGVYAGIGGQRPSSPKKPGNYGQFEIINLKKIK